MAGHLQERGPKTWRLSVYVGRDSRTGRKRYAQRTVHGTKTRGREGAGTTVPRSTKGRHSASAAGTFGNLLDRWLETKAQSVDPATISNYQWVTEKYVRPGLGRTRLASLKAADIDSFYVRLAAQPGDRGKMLSSSTIRICHTVIRQALDQARRWVFIRATPPSTPAHPDPVTTRSIPPRSNRY